jgi:hypothetical protein
MSITTWRDLMAFQRGSPVINARHVRALPRASGVHSDDKIVDVVATSDRVVSALERVTFEW